MKPLKLIKISFVLVLFTLSACGGGGGSKKADLDDPTAGIIANNFFYVNATATDDSGDGLTPSTPKKMINSAIALAAAGDAILVAEGTYSVSSGTDHVQLVEGVSLYGGFSSDFSARDLQTYPSIIQETLTTGGSSFNPNRAVEAGTGITTATIVEGFTLLAGDSTDPGNNSTAIFVHNGGSPTIRNNLIKGGAGLRTNGIVSYLAGAADIHNNIIHSGSATSWAFGINNTNSSSPVIYNNLIVGGGTGTSSYGISDNNSSSVIRNNTINGGTGGVYSYGIYITGLGGSTVIENNIIYNSGGATRLCIGEGNDTAPGSVRNNDLFGCPAGLYVNQTGGTAPVCSFNAGSTCYTDIADVNLEANTTGGADGTADGNISADALFVDDDGDDNDITTVEDNDWRLTAGSPAIAAGLNGNDEGWSFTEDMDGVARPAAGNPWAMGAYEP